jgi:hypothetical protein
MFAAKETISVLSFLPTRLEKILIARKHKYCRPRTLGATKACSTHAYCQRSNAIKAYSTGENSV